MFFTRTHARLLRQGLSHTFDPQAIPTPIRRHFDNLDNAIDAFIGGYDLAASNLTQPGEARGSGPTSNSAAQSTAST